MYQFGPYQIDSLTFRLLKEGREIEIEPQVFKTLLMLVENRERVVTKDELLQEIWHGRAVTDQVITRMIYELRKIFGGKSGNNSFIRTVRGQGYQFIAEVTVIDHDRQQSFDSNPSKVSQPRSWTHRNWKISGVILLLFIGLLVIYQLLKQQPIDNQAAFQTEQNIYPVIAVLPIDVETGNEELSMLVESLTEYLINQLTVNLNMKVIHPDNLRHLRGQLDDVWAIQQVTHADYLIRGFVESTSTQSINLHLSLYKHDKYGELVPFQLGAFKFTFPKNAQALDKLYKQRKLTVRSIVQIIEPGVVVEDNTTSETDDPEAYRLVIAAHHISRDDDCNDLQRAEELLLRAVERDDEFAYAYYQLFANYFKRVWLCGESKEYHLKAMAMAEKVERLSPNVYSPMYKGVNVILVESNQVEKAFQLSQAANWNDPDAINHKVYGLRYAGFLNLASTLIDRVLQLDPFYYSEKPINQAPNTLMYLGQFDEYMALLAEPGSSYHDYYRGLSLTLSGQSDQAVNLLQGVIDRKSESLFDTLSHVLLLTIKQQHAAAVEIIDNIVEQRNLRKLTDGEMTYKLVQLYALAGAKEKALKNLQRSVDQGFFPMNYFLYDPALDLIKNTTQFSEIVKQATERHKAFAEKFNLKSEAR